MKITLTIWQEISKLYRDGFSIREIEKKTGASKTAIDRHLKKNKVQKRPVGPYKKRKKYLNDKGENRTQRVPIENITDKRERERIVELYLLPHGSLRAVEEQIGRTWATVKDVLEAEGIPLRRKGRPSS